jgi:hypothetical protein
LGSRYKEEALRDLINAKTNNILLERKLENFEALATNKQQWKKV